MHRDTSHPVRLTFTRKSKAKHKKWSHVCTLIKVPGLTVKVMILGVLGTFIFAVCALPMAKLFLIQKLIARTNFKNHMCQKTSKCGY